MIITHVTNVELQICIKCRGPIYLILMFRCPVCNKIITRSSNDTYKSVIIPKGMIAELIDDVLYLYRVSALPCGFCEIDYENLPGGSKVLYIFQ